MIKKFIFITNFIVSTASAQDLVVETYCFPNEATSLKAQKSAQYMMLPSDRIEPKGSCFSLFTTDARRELIQKYLFNSYQQMRVDYSSVESATDECQLSVEKIKTQNSQSIQMKTGYNPRAQTRERNKESKEHSQIRVMSGAPFELKVDDQEITGICRYINPTRYEITFSMKFIPKPIVPSAPPGTIVVINNPPSMKNQTGTNLSTTVQMNKGERIELGSISKKLEDQGHEVSLVPEVSVGKKDGQTHEKIFLMIK